ncbi:hypothetical protein chiPu_0018583 [Chiloscyllium punctatum]|uniref:VWFD domain-containing protein n=1 Tax=Chiloscyllium punctatum TaxID=137246 RepID=A0A401RNU9_CHIPU|nr:hypothetical protein [Chiloscyllium punctatum]
MATPFTISGKNEERGMPYASYLSEVHIAVEGLNIAMQKSRRLLLNDKLIRTPFEDNVAGVNIYSSGIYNVLETSCHSDDREDLDPMCTAKDKKVWTAQCQELLTSKYQQCHSTVKPAAFIENCVFDMCMYSGMTSTLCDNIQSYIEACKSEGIDIKWRNSTFCPFETCLISGDPHYLTFDGLAHHFQGKGTYTLVTTHNISEALQPINIEGKNEVRNRNTKISYLSAVYIKVYGHSIEFHKKKRFLLDDERVIPPYKSREGFHVYQRARTLYLETDFGVSVNFDGRENAGEGALQNGRCGGIQLV